jgi:hypothetical protein
LLTLATQERLVDGARGILPIGGGRDGLKITSWECDAANLLHNLKGGTFGAFEDFYDRVPFCITDSEIIGI